MPAFGFCSPCNSSSVSSSETPRCQSKDVFCQRRRREGFGPSRRCETVEFDSILRRLVAKCTDCSRAILPLNQCLIEVGTRRFNTSLNQNRYRPCPACPGVSVKKILQVTISTSCVNLKIILGHSSRAGGVLGGTLDHGGLRALRGLNIPQNAQKCERKPGRLDS